MNIISHISIRYFRSVYSANINKCCSLNIISGRNDAGKSNILKALNLFFNGEPDWGKIFDFYSNFSQQRLSQVRRESVKGKQFISIKITFNRPSNYKGSLPEKFNVERRWHRDSDLFEQKDDLQYWENQGLLPSRLSTAQRHLKRFLGRIHYEYIPAVKDRSYFNGLLSRLQDSLLDNSIANDADLMNVATSLAAHISGQIGELQADFKRATQIDTSIQPPRSISSLFQAFLVSTKTSSGDLPLVYRGDGLQARYIPSALHYISKKTSDFYIWGYEEPEMALEYNHATMLAQDFVNEYSNNIQIFLTTHSPAFVSLAGEDVACYRVYQEDAMTRVVNTGDKAKSMHAELLRDELGILSIQKEIHEKYSEKLAELASLRQNINSIRNELDQHQCPVIITEGKTDQRILTVAYSKLYPQASIPYLIRSSDTVVEEGGNGGASSLARMIESIHPEDKRIAVAVFDHDEEGIKEFKKLSVNFRNTDLFSNIKKHLNGFSYALLLPVPDFRMSYAEAKNLCIEYMFSDNVLMKKNDKGFGLVFKNVENNMVVAGKTLNNVPEDIKEAVLKHYEEFKAYRKISSGKALFANEIVPHLDSEEFSSFHLLFQLIDRLIDVE